MSKHILDAIIFWFSCKIDLFSDRICCLYAFKAWDGTDGAKGAKQTKGAKHTKGAKQTKGTKHTKGDIHRGTVIDRIQQRPTLAKFVSKT